MESEHWRNCEWVEKKKLGFSKESKQSSLKIDVSIRSQDIP